VRIRLAVVSLLSLLTAAAQNRIASSHALETFVVTGRRPSASDAGPDGIRTYDQSEIDASGAFTLEEFLESLPRGSGEGQVVLIDGMPADQDIASLTPAMVAAIEVSYSGAMPAYGAYARGRIINIRLNQDYRGGELQVQGGGSLHADAWNQEVSLTGAFPRGDWRMGYSLRYSGREAVTADARDFSRQQDHRAFGGRDFRLPWGDPAVVQAVSGNLAGVIDAAGNPVAVALVPENSDGTLTPGEFLPGNGSLASGQRFFNTSPYLYLATPAERLGGNFSLMRTIGKLRLGGNVGFDSSRSRRAGPPPVTGISADTLVPALLNPFGQDIEVGLVHTGFGPVVQRSTNHNAQLSLNGIWTGKDWRAMSRLYYSRSRSDSATRDLDTGAFAAALAATNPAARFNPFTGADSGANAALYPTLAVDRIQQSASESTRLNGLVFGPLAPGWGAGPVQLNVNGNANWRRDTRTVRQVRGLADGTSRDASANYQLGAGLTAPLRKDRPWFHRLDVRVDGSYSFSDGGGDTRRVGGGWSWAPSPAWAFSAQFRQNTSSPGERGPEDPEATVATLMDPRRAPAVAENVQVISRRSDSTAASHSEQWQADVTYMPKARPGLEFGAGYYWDRQARATGSPFEPQDVIDNEALLPGRVVRDAPTVADLAVGQPGRILVVDTTATAVASRENRTLRASAEYQMPGQGPGRWMFSVSGEYPLANRYEVAAGQAFVSREDSPANQPDWTARANVRWQGRAWSFGVQLRHTAESQLGTIPALTSAGCNVGYRFTKPIHGKFGKGLQLGARLQNLGRDRPPYADVIQGYRGGSAVGPTLALSVRLPL
jgi:hypothetical protein